MTTLPLEVQALAQEVRMHKAEERRHRQQKRLKAAELEALCEKLGINYRKVDHHGTAGRHSRRDGSDAATG